MRRENIRLQITNFEFKFRDIRDCEESLKFEIHNLKFEIRFNFEGTSNYLFRRRDLLF